MITGATVRLVEDAPYKIMIALGYPTMADAADAAPLIVDHRPTACEGLDRRIVDVVRRTRGDAAVPALPRGTVGCSSSSSVTIWPSCGCARMRC